MIVIGIDPGLRKTGFASYCTIKQRVVQVGVFEVSKKLAQRAAAKAMCEELKELPFDENELVVVESQEAAYAKNPQSIAMLSWIGGAAMQAATSAGCRVEFPAPAEWKGQVPKHIHQMRTYGRLGWEAKYNNVREDGRLNNGGKNSYAYPTKIPYDVLGAKDLNRSDWKEVGDAIGLALWGAKKCK